MTKDYATVSDAIARRDRQIAQSVDNLARLTNVFAKNSKLLDDAVAEISGVSTNLNQVLDGNEEQVGRISGKLRGGAAYTSQIPTALNDDALSTSAGEQSDFGPRADPTERVASWILWDGHRFNHGTRGVRRKRRNQTADLVVYAYRGIMQIFLYFLAIRFRWVCSRECIPNEKGGSYELRPNPGI
jgi:hypothetical protein